MPERERSARVVCIGRGFFLFRYPDSSVVYILCWKCGWNVMLLSRPHPTLWVHWCDCYSFVYFINKSFGTTVLPQWAPRQRWWAGMWTLHSKSGHVFCSKPDGVWRGRVVAEEDSLPPRGGGGGVLSWPDRCQCKECQLQICFFESPSRRQTVPVMSSCACKPVWWRGRTVQRSCSSVGCTNREFSLSYHSLYRINYSDLANCFLWLE